MHRGWLENATSNTIIDMPKYSNKGLPLSILGWLHRKLLLRGVGNFDGTVGEFNKVFRKVIVNQFSLREKTIVNNFTEDDYLHCWNSMGNLLHFCLTSMLSHTVFLFLQCNSCFIIFSCKVRGKMHFYWNICQ